MKYKTVTADNAPDLDKKVQEMLDADWELCGTPYATGNTLHQCVVAGAPREEAQSGLTVDDIATLSLLRGGMRPRRRW